MESARGVLNRAAFWIPMALTTTVGLGWAGLMWLYCKTAIALGNWPRPKVDDPRHFMSELQYELGGFFVGALAIGSFAILVVLAALAAADQKGSLSPSGSRRVLNFAVLGPYVDFYAG